MKRQRWVFPTAEAKGKKHPRIVYLTDSSFEITKKLMEIHPTGQLFRNSTGKPWTKDAVGCAFTRVMTRMGKVEMLRRGIAVTSDDFQALIPTLTPNKRSRGRVIKKSEAELRAEAKRKLTNKLAANAATRFSLYGPRHSWATRALESGA